MAERSGVADSNRRCLLGRERCYRYTNPARPPNYNADRRFGASMIRGKERVKKWPRHWTETNRNPPGIMARLIVRQAAPRIRREGGGGGRRDSQSHHSARVRQRESLIKYLFELTTVSKSLDQLVTTTRVGVKKDVR